MPVKNIYKMGSEINFAKALAWFAIGMAIGGPSCWTSWGCFAVAIRDLILSITMYIAAAD